jgi:eukaryotic-like serine/threonine-protein kinase
MTYTVIREIGKGNFGVVKLVKDDEGNRWALKVFTPPNLPDVSNEELRARFEREVRYQLQIDHPNVVRIVDFDLAADPPWFVMELAQGSLAEELKADSTLGGDPRRPLFDILAGLEAIHGKGYKHRDLKPANVLKFVSADGDVRYAISDFGLMAPGAGLTSTLTASNMGGGTPLYRAPECALNFKRATVQSDIYSVGAICTISLVVALLAFRMWS